MIFSLSDQGYGLSGYRILISNPLVIGLDNSGWNGRQTENSDRAAQPFGVSEALGSSSQNLEPDTQLIQEDELTSNKGLQRSSDFCDTDDDGSNGTCSKSSSTVEILKSKTQTIKKTILKSWYDNLGLVLTPPTRRKFDSDGTSQDTNSIIINSCPGKAMTTSNVPVCPHADTIRVSSARPGSWIGQEPMAWTRWNTLPRNWAPNQEDNDLVWLWFIK